MGSKLIKLEAIRGFAALYIVFHHIYGYYKPLIIGGCDLTFISKFGTEAVIIFFILSGFVISYSFERSKDKSFSLFFAKRFFRIYIPLICVFITNYIVFIFKYDCVHFDWGALVGNLLMLQDIPREGIHTIVNPFLMNDPLWSLAYEWWFYMIFFFFMTRFQNKSSLIIYSLSVIAAITFLFYPCFLNRVIMYMSIWWLGVDLARLYINKESVTLTSMKLPLISFLLIMGITILHMYLYNIGQSFLYPNYDLITYRNLFIMFIAAYLWYKSGWKFFNYTIGPFRYVASISYVVYISHWFLVTWATYFDFISNGYVRIIAYITVCFLFSYLVERQIYPRLNKFFMSRLFPNRLVRKN